MKAVVLGLGISGKSAAAFLERRGYDVIGLDDRNGPFPEIDWNSVSLFVPSPGIAQSHPLYRKAKEKNIPIKGEATLGLEAANQPCIGITGTNGKTTVVHLISHCLNQFNRPAVAVGNNGVPITSVVDQKNEILVVELSSFQIETLSPALLDVGIVLNITPDHLDRYRDFQEYAETKLKLKDCVRREGKFWVHETFAEDAESFNGDNIEAAFLACSFFGMERTFFLNAISSFEKPPHRLEFVGKIDGVRYFNDSKATNVSAVEHALSKCKSPCVLLLGGQDKNLDFSPLCSWGKQVSHVIAFGQARGKITDALKEQLNVHVVETLQEAVALSKKVAVEGMEVILSPGCTSFDAFENYQARGEAFKRFVEELK